MRRMLRASAALLALAAASSAMAVVRINEVRTDNASTDINEYFELSGTPGESLAGLTYLVLGDPGSGTIEHVSSLSGVIPADGYFLAAESTLILNPGQIDLNLGASGLNFENDDNYTHLLVAGFSGALNADLDTNDDGVLDLTPWTAIVDQVALIGEGTDQVYSATQVGPDPIKGSPWHVYRFPNGSGPWTFDSFDNGGAGTDLANYPTDTPGVANVPEPTALVLLALGALALRRR